ncbi:signal peptidase I [Candidatus Parcubacteria bacterium]|nr:MAG: signal peptidase I [Candidatus Parcubacteria bacterium]
MSFDSALPPRRSEPTPEPKFASTLRRTIGEFLRLAVIAAAIALPIRYFIAQPFVVDGASMSPNFIDGQYLVVDELTYFLRPPERGEVVVFRYPRNPQTHFIKRIIGLPGETVEIREGDVYIANAEYPDGFKLEESYLPEDVHIPGAFKFVLGPEEYVVLGDNRAESSDSRYWGTLERRLITGRAIFRAWPPTDFGPIVQP